MGFARSSALFLLLGGAMAARASAENTVMSIDGRHSSARISVHMRIPMRAEGRMSPVTGELRGNASLGWRVLVKADGRSLHFEGAAWIERVSRSDAFLAVERYPAIQFESQQFTDAVLHKGGPLRGRLTLRGVTHPVGFELTAASCARVGRDCPIQVQGSISRREFGMTSHRATVRDDVDLRIRVRLQQDASAQ